MNGKYFYTLLFLPINGVNLVNVIEHSLKPTEGIVLCNTPSHFIQRVSFKGHDGKVKNFLCAVVDAIWNTIKSLRDCRKLCEMVSKRFELNF